MKRKMRNSVKIILSILIVVFGSCTRSNNQGDQNDEKFADTAYNSSDIQQVYIVFPSPDDLMQIISESDIRYSSEYTIGKIFPDDYQNQTSVNLNIGILLADLAYCILFENHTEEARFVEALTQMGQRIYLSPEMRKKLLHLNETRTQTHDYRKFSSGSLFYEVIRDLENSGQGITVAEISAGAYVESLFLIIKSSTELSQKEDLYRTIAELRFSFKNMYLYLQQYKSDQEVAEIIELVRPVEEIFNRLEYLEDKVQVTRDSDTTISISGGKVYYFNDPTFSMLSDRICSVRQNFIDRR